MKKTFFTKQISNCDRRKMDLGEIKSYLLSNGYQEVAKEADADVLIVMSCTTTDANVDQSLNTINTLIERKHPNSKLIVNGCLSKSEMSKLVLDKLFLISNPKDGMNPLIEKLKLKQPISKANQTLMPFYNFIDVRIQSGCMGKCTYCNIKEKIGRTKSRVIQDILDDLKNVNKTIEYIRLIGDDVGSYGIELDINLPVLLNEILNSFPSKKLFIDNLDPKYFIKFENELLPFIKRGQVFHIKLPVQHFDSKLLERMGRYADVTNMERVIKILNDNKVFIYTHFIVGFPGENEEDCFNAIERLLNLNIGQIAFIPYSKKEGTKAAKMENYLSVDDLKLRMQKIKDYLKERNEFFEIPYIDENGIEEIKLITKEYNNARYKLKAL